MTELEQDVPAVVAVEQPRVGVEVVDGVAHVRLQRADKLNGVDWPMLHALVAAAARLRADREVRVVVLTGDGPSFSAGLDFASVMRSPARMARGFVPLPGSATNTFQRACWAWRRLPVPVVAVIRGHCYGAGLQLALAADFRFATPDARLSVLEAKWGLVPDMSGTVTLREVVGGDVARRLAMTGEVVSGTRALEIGLVTGVHVDPDVPAAELAATIVSRSPDAVAATKLLLNRTRHLSPRAAMRLERVLQLRLLLGRNAAIARTSAMDRTPPRFRPRSLLR